MKTGAIIFIFVLLNVIFVSTVPQKMVQNCGPEGCELNSYQFQQKPSSYPGNSVFYVFQERFCRQFLFFQRRADILMVQHVVQRVVDQFETTDMVLDAALTDVDRSILIKIWKVSLLSKYLNGCEPIQTFRNIKLFENENSK